MMLGSNNPCIVVKVAFQRSLGVDAYVVVTGSDVNLGEPLGISEFCDQGRNQWQWVSIPDRPFIDILIILAGSQIPSFLSDEKEPAGLRRLRRMDEVLSEVVVEEGFYSFCFFWGNVRVVPLGKTRVEGLGFSSCAAPLTRVRALD